MQFRTRKRGTPRQIGMKFPVLEKKSLPPRISMPSPRGGGKIMVQLTSKESIAKEMAGKPIEKVSYAPPINGRPGKIMVKYDGALLNNSVFVTPEKNVGTWDRLRNAVYVDPMLPERYRKSISAHEAVEKYLRERHGLHEDREGHETAERVEKKTFLIGGGTLKDYSNYSKIVEQIHRKRTEEEQRAGGKMSPEHEIKPSKKAHFRVTQQSINWKKMQAAHYDKKARIVQMSPEKYLKMVPSLIDERSSALAQYQVTGEKYFSQNSLKFIQNQIEKGEEISIPWVDHSDMFRGWPSHEGRHRALVAKKMGIKRIPVMVIK